MKRVAELLPAVIIPIKGGASVLYAFDHAAAQYLLHLLHSDETYEQTSEWIQEVLDNDGY